MATRSADTGMDEDHFTALSQRSVCILTQSHQKMYPFSFGNSAILFGLICTQFQFMSYHKSMNTIKDV